MGLYKFFHVLTESNRILCVFISLYAALSVIIGLYRFVRFFMGTHKDA